MTDPCAPTPTAGGSAVDRRWFEEALRSQGFVVEPPSVDGPPVDPAAEPDARADAADAADAPPTERPPVPSALLARIAARGTPTPDAQPSTNDWPSAAPASPSPPGTPMVSTPWGDALVASVAPWAPTEGATVAPPDASPETATLDPAPPPTLTAAEQTEAPPEATAEPGDPAEPAEAPPGTMVGPGDPAEAAEVPPEAMGVPGDPAEPSANPVAQTLQSPYAEPVAMSAVAVGAPTASSGPDASEGELWALVSGSEPRAAQATGSGWVRVLLTVLTALVILIVVIGSLVLASQLA
ncbi:MAG: hypothetical protein U0667_12730 [Chloroflexota bacterium]